MNLRLATLCLLLCAATLPAVAQQRTPRKEKKSPDAAAEREGKRTSYDMLYQVQVPPFADLVTSKIRADAERELYAKQATESAEDFQIRQLASQTIVDSICRTVQELDSVKLGWSVDRSHKRTFLDLSFKAIKGSGLESQLAELRERKSAFDGFVIPGAPLSARVVGQAAATDAAGYAKAVDALRDKSIKSIEQDSISSDEKAIRKDLVEKIFDVIQRSVASGRSDAAASLQLADNRITLVAATYVADGAKLESALKPIGQFLQQNHPAFSSLRFNVETCEGVNFHTLSIPAPFGNEREKFVQLFGEQLEVVVGFGKEAIYLAAGRDAVSALKQAITDSKSPKPLTSPCEVTLAVKPIADFVAAVGKGNDQATAKMISEVLASGSADAVVRLTTQVEKRILTWRIEASEGIVQWLARMNPDLQRLLLGQ